MWCSWYRYFEEVTAADVVENLRAFDEHDLAVDVVQVDDGWSPGPRRGPAAVATASARCPALVDDVRGRPGRRAGIWLAPFLVGARHHAGPRAPRLAGRPGRDATGARTWSGLDLTHPGVRDLLVEHAAGGWSTLGVDYLKLDFLYGGAVPGPPPRRRSPASRPTAPGSQLVREAVGPDVYLVGCGAPLLPSVGLVDAMRVSPDTFHEGGEDGSTGLRGLMPLAARAWQQGRLWVNDPDCVVARPSYSAARAVGRGGGRRSAGCASFSDRVAELDELGPRRRPRRCSPTGGTAAPFAPDRVASGAPPLARPGSDGAT